MKRRITITLVVLTLVCCYLFGALYYKFHFYPNTAINGLDVSGCIAKEAGERLAAVFDDYKLTITGLESVDEIPASAIQLRYETEDGDGNSYLASLLSDQNTLSWPLVLAGNGNPREASLGLVYDEELLQEAVDSLVCCNPDSVREPEDAYITYEDGEYIVVPEVSGNVADATEVLASVCDAVESGVTEISVEDYYETAEVLSDDKKLNATVAAANQILSSDITIETVHHSVTLDNDTIQGFLVIDDDGNVDIDEELVRDWVKENVASPNSTVGAERTIETPSSGTVTISGGNYGMVVDTDTETEQLVEELKAGTEITREPACSTSEASSENAGVGYTYIDVNISRQMVYLVVDNEVTYSTACVTGKVSSGHSTPTGVYSVQWKTKNWTMKKYNTFVYYWMPISNQTGVGLHDATWRSKFGGTIYQKNGSHGCINLPKAAAKYIYENTSVGIPVIVH